MIKSDPLPPTKSQIFVPDANVRHVWTCSCRFSKIFEKFKIRKFRKKMKKAYFLAQFRGPKMTLEMIKKTKASSFHP